jgi:hypothetical protein
MSIVRIWRTRVKSMHLDDHLRFARERSLPMFGAQVGFRGVIYAGHGENQRVVSFWADHDAVTPLASSPSYRMMVQAIEGTGFLSGEPRVEVFDSEGGRPAN